MHTWVHKAICSEALKLLPPDLHERFTDPDGEYAADGLPGIHWVRDGAEAEDTTVGPLGRPAGDEAAEARGLLGAWGETGGLATLEATQAGIYPWVEHYWKHPARQEGKHVWSATGLTNPYGFPLVFRAAYRRAEDYYGEHVRGSWRSDRRQALVNLGRVLHLLQDMAVPAHVNNDPHANLGPELAREALRILSGKSPVDRLVLAGADDDDFEDYVGAEMLNDRNPWPAGRHGHFRLGDADWTMKQWFAAVAGVTQCYDSDDAKGTARGYPYEWSLLTKVVDGHAVFGRDCTGDLTDYACRTIAGELLPLSYGFTAGLIVKFLLDVGERIPPMYTATVALERLRVRDDADRPAPGGPFIDFGCLTDGKARSDGGLWIRPGDCEMRDGEAYAIGPPASHVVQFDGDQEDEVFLVFDVWRCDEPEGGPGNWLASVVDSICGSAPRRGGSQEIAAPEVLLSSRKRHAFSALERLAGTGKKTASVKSGRCEVDYTIEAKRLWAEDKTK